jgi:hypothetical protein
MPDNTSDRTQPPADGDNRRTSVPPDPDTHTRPTPVASGATTHTEKTVTKRNRSNLVLGIVGALVVAALLIVAITSGFIRFGTPDAQQPTNVEQLINDAVQKAKDADKATFDKAQKEAADKAAELRAEIDRLKKQPATGGSGTSTVGNADGAGTPTADAAQTEINRDTFRKIIQENGQREGEDYRFNIDRDLAARVNPGVGVFGKPIFNEQELVSSLGDGSATSERALKALQDKQLEKNGLTVSRQNLLDARNYVCVQQLKPNKSNDMAYVAADGSIAWDNKLVDPAYSVNCAYVGPEVRTALASGKKVTAIGKRGACLNTEEMPVTVNETPTLPLLETPVTPYKPTIPIITVVNKTKIEICELLTKKIITINKDEFDATKHTTDLSKCKEVPVKIQVCELKTKKIISINKDQFDSTEHTTDLSKCEDKPEKIQVCELSSKTIKMINKDEFDATKHTTDLSKCKPVEECPPGQKPNPHNPKQCLEIKDEAQLPENNDNAPHNGTLMPDPGPATPPAVPKSDAPVVPTTPAVPEPVKVPRETEVPIVNEGAPVTAPVTGVTDSTTCAVCGGGMSEPAQAAPVAAPVAAVVQAAPVAATQPAVAAPAVVKEAAPVVAAPAAAAPAPVATQVASAPAVTDASVQVASAPVVSDASAQTATAPAVAVVATSVTTAAG